MPPIKILHLISTLDVGGAEQNLLRLVSSMDRTSYDSTVVSMTNIGPVGKEIMSRGLPVHALNMKKGIPDLRGVSRLKKLVSRVRPHIIQCWMYHANLFGLLFSRKRHLVWNIRCSDMDLSQYGFVYKYTVKAGGTFSKIPDAVIANSYAGKAFHEGLGYSSQRWAIIPNGFDTDLFKPDAPARKGIRHELGIPDDAPVIGLVARFDPMKDHATFFHAAHLLLQTYPSVHFILAGQDITSDNPELLRLIGHHHNSRQFLLLGQRHDIPDVLTALDIATSSSLSEGLPNTIGEAMAAGIPCVVTDVGDSRVLVGDTGLVVPKNRPELLTKAWQKLIDAGPDHIRLLGGRARKRIEQDYSLDSTVRHYEKLYNDLIATSVK